MMTATLSSSVHPFFFFIAPATTVTYTLSLHDALPISSRDRLQLFGAYLGRSRPEPSVAGFDRVGDRELLSHDGQRNERVAATTSGGEADTAGPVVRPGPAAVTGVTARSPSGRRTQCRRRYGHNAIPAVPCRHRTVRCKPLGRSPEWLRKLLAPR